MKKRGKSASQKVEEEEEEQADGDAEGEEAEEERYAYVKHPLHQDKEDLKILIEEYE